MVEELKRALDKAENLPESQQKKLAEVILNEIAWGEAMESSADKLSALAKEALSEYKDGKTKPFEL